MQKPKKLPRDINSRAAKIVAMSTGQPIPGQDSKLVDDGKDPAAVALGRRGGMKGGRARAEALSKRKRSEIAKLAAAARWKKS